MKTKKSKIIAILTIITSVLGLILFILQTKFQNLNLGNYIFICFLFIGVISGIFMIKNKKWAYWIGLFFYLLQIVEIHTKKIYFNFTSGISFKIGTENVHQLDNGKYFIESNTINIFAIVMLFMIITILFQKDKEEIPFHIRDI